MHSGMQMANKHGFLGDYAYNLHILCCLSNQIQKRRIHCETAPLLKKKQNSSCRPLFLSFIFYPNETFAPTGNEYMRWQFLSDLSRYPTTCQYHCFKLILHIQILGTGTSITLKMTVALMRTAVENQESNYSEVSANEHLNKGTKAATWPTMWVTMWHGLRPYPRQLEREPHCTLPHCKQ